MNALAGLISRATSILCFTSVTLNRRCTLHEAQLIENDRLQPGLTSRECYGMLQAGARCRRLLDEQAEDHKTELAAAQSSGEQQVAEAHIRLQSMSQECREQREATERRLQGSEQATSALKAAHEKTLRKTMAQHARKVSPLYNFYFSG